MKFELIIVAVISFFSAFIAINLSLYESLAFALFIYFFIKFVYEFGNSLWLTLDIIIVQALLTWMLVPIIFYRYYNENNYLAVLWVKTMPVSSFEYYSFLLPGTIALIIGLQENKTLRSEINSKIKTIIRNKDFSVDHKVGINIILVSGLAYIFSPFAPDSLDFVFNLGKKIFLVGLAYLYFSKIEGNYIYILVGFIFLIWGGIQSAMFGELIFLSLLFSIILSMNIELKFSTKLTYIFLGMFFILLFQNIKYDYRGIAWKTGADSQAFAKIIYQNLTHPEKIFDPNRQFFTAVRFNQGWLIASTMYRVPRSVPFANGETILLSIAGSVIPRFLWPDKPESGGQYNLTRFLGYGKIGYSMNISPIGEAYANFGRTGGIIFMFFYGLFFRYAFRYLLIISEYRPTIILWIPILFQYSVGVETDILSTVNSLIKSSIFIFLLYKIWPLAFKSEL